MKPVLAFLLFIVVSQQSFSQQANRTADEKTLRYLKEVEWPKAYREQDTALLDRILADEFKMISSDGEYSTKKDQLDYIRTHPSNNISFRFEIKRLEIFENNTAIVSGTGIIHRKDNDGEYELTYQSSNVLIKRKGQWKAISSHTSGDKVKRL